MSRTERDRVLITGGAGFIGTRLVNQLSGRYEVVVLDNFSPQVHGADFTDSYLYRSIRDRCTIVRGDVRSRDDVAGALEGVRHVIHLAAETGTGQSMYELNRYTSVNIQGTANLLEAMLRNEQRPEKLIVGSSRAVYGEGRYACQEHGLVVPRERNVEDMKKGAFDVRCPVCGRGVAPAATSEDSPAAPVSYYGFTKLAQETMVEMMCPAMDMPYTICRYQNVYGPGQSLRNPYTGILSIFSRQLLRGLSINIYEDGLESRDFIHVHDAAAITCNALTNRSTDNQRLNVGSGESTSVLQVAETLRRFYSSGSDIRISGDFRKGDIRHNRADMTKTHRLCGITPSYDFESGISEFTRWVMEQDTDPALRADDDHLERSLEELKSAGMLIQHREPV